jgi:ParB family chromosome partitioning protein
MAGLSEIPAIVREIDDEEAALLALIENLQREDLNPVEEAMGYRDLMERYSLTQEEAAKRVGKARASVANLLRILKLPAQVLGMVEDGRISFGHARTLLPLAEQMDGEALAVLADKVAEQELSVRQTEAMVKSLLTPVKVEPVKKDPVQTEYFRTLERKISDSAGRKAYLKREKDGSGKLVLSYASSRDLEELLVTLCGKEFLEELNETL